MEMELYLRYPVDVRWSDRDKLWIAEVYDLPGCLADGESREEALTNASEAARLWVEVAREDGREIPEPSIDEDDASGEFLVRTTKGLHSRLKHEARRQGVSLNQLVATLLAERSSARRRPS